MFLYRAGQKPAMADASIDEARRVDEAQREVVLDLGSGAGIDCFLAGKQVSRAGTGAGTGVPRW